MGRTRAECRDRACPTLFRVVACRRKGSASSRDPVGTGRTPTSHIPLPCPLKAWRGIFFPTSLAILLGLAGISGFWPPGPVEAGSAPTPIKYVDITQKSNLQFIHNTGAFGKK